MIATYLHICTKATPKGGRCCKYPYDCSGIQDTNSVLTVLVRLPKQKRENQDTPKSVLSVLVCPLSQLESLFFKSSMHSII